VSCATNAKLVRDFDAQGVLLHTAFIEAWAY